MQQHVQRQGVIYALRAYTLCGLAPISFHTIAPLPLAFGMRRNSEP